MQGLTVGRIVHYVLTDQDVEQINRRRVPTVGHGENWPQGAQAHVGSPALTGDHIPMLVVRVWPESDSLINGQCFLDGNDVLWVTSRVFNEDKVMGTWHWIEKA